MRLGRLQPRLKLRPEIIRRFRAETKHATTLLHNSMYDVLSLSEQFVDRRRVFQKRRRTTAVIEEVQCRVDAHRFVDGGVNMLRANSAGVRAVPFSIGRTDDLTSANSAAAQQAEHRRPPVITTGSSLAERGTAIAAVVHTWRSAKLPAHND